MNVRHFLKLIGATLIYLVTNVAISILYVAFYAYVINPGHPPVFYEQYANVAAPYSSIFAGMPLMFLMCWWLSRRWTPDLALKSVLVIWIIYVIIDLSVLFASGMTTRLAIFSSISLATKLIAAVLGARKGSGSGSASAVIEQG